MTQQPAASAASTARKLAIRLEEMADGRYRLDVSSGPVFVLLATPIGYDDMLQPALGDCEAAAEALRASEPAGYLITKRNLRGRPPRTFGAEFSDENGDPYAYVHVSSHGMIEIVAGGFTDYAHRLVSLGQITESIREHDAAALHAAFDALGANGAILIEVALLRTDGVAVVRDRYTPDVNISHASSVTIGPVQFASRLALDATQLNRMVDDLWRKMAASARTA